MTRSQQTPDVLKVNETKMPHREALFCSFHTFFFSGLSTVPGTGLIPSGVLRVSSAVTFFNELNRAQTQAYGAGAAALSHGSPWGRRLTRRQY